jgi:hypothetical protein
MQEAVKEGYGGEGGLRRGSFYGIIIFLGGFSWIAERGVEFCSWIGSVQAPVCWRFWARGPGYPYDILELGSCPSWQGGTRFGQCLHSSAAVNKASGKRRVSIRPR